jgi:hypothetical protein
VESEKLLSIISTQGMPISLSTYMDGRYFLERVLGKMQCIISLVM